MPHLDGSLRQCQRVSAEVLTGLPKKKRGEIAASEELWVLCADRAAAL